MATRNTTANNAGYTAHLERPSKEKKASRGVVGLLLTLLLPPVGLFLLWSQGIFRARGRLVLTVLATVEMTALLVWLTPHQELAPRQPMPAAPAPVEPQAEGETLNALYNIEQLLYEQQLADVIAAGGSERDLMTEEEKLAQAAEQNEAIYATTVYCVFDGPIYYHTDRVCGTQTNGRELTVREAVQEGLQPCPDCSPPAPSDL